MTTEDFYIKIICEKIEEKFDHGSISLWKNNDYIVLGRDIFEKSKTTISPDTLKRIFGKKKSYREDSNPQFSTKNALALYLDFSDWEAFKKTIKTPEIQDINNKKKEEPKPGVNVKPKAIILIVGLLVCGFTAWFFIIDQKEKYDYAFVASPKYGSVPLNVKLNFDLSGASPADEYSIDFDYPQYYNPTAIEAKVKKPMKEAFESYRLPGWFKPKLKRKGAVVDSTQMLVMSDKKWFGIVNDHHTGYFLPLPYTKKDGLMYYDPKYLEENDFTVRLQYFTEFRYFDTIPIVGDQCKFSVKLKNNILSGGTSCYDIVVILTGEKGNFRMHFVEPGCQKWCQMDFSDVHLDGRYMDLAAFGQKFDTLRTIDLVAENNQVIVFLDNKPIFNQKYNTSIGKIKGMTTRFKGCGVVDKISIKGKADSLSFDF